MISLCIISGFYGFSLGLYRAFGNRVNLMYSVHNYTLLVLDAIFVIASICTYSYFYRLVKRIKQSSPRRLATKNSKFIIPFLIVLSYLLFNVTSTILFQVWRHIRPLGPAEPSYLLTMARVLTLLGFTCDSILHIFSQRRIRVKLRGLLTTKSKENSAKCQELRTNDITE